MLEIHGKIILKFHLYDDDVTSELPTRLELMTQFNKRLSLRRRSFKQKRSKVACKSSSLLRLRKVMSRSAVTSSLLQPPPSPPRRRARDRYHHQHLIAAPTRSVAQNACGCEEELAYFFIGNFSRTRDLFRASFRCRRCCCSAERLKRLRARPHQLHRVFIFVDVSQSRRASRQAGR